MNKILKRRNPYYDFLIKKTKKLSQIIHYNKNKTNYLSIHF